jgi:hypothetical protein
MESKTLAILAVFITLAMVYVVNVLWKMCKEYRRKEAFVTDPTQHTPSGPFDKNLFIISNYERIKGHTIPEATLAYFAKMWNTSATLKKEEMITLITAHKVDDSHLPQKQTKPVKHQKQTKQKHDPHSHNDTITITHSHPPPPPPKPKCKINVSELKSISSSLNKFLHQLDDSCWKKDPDVVQVKSEHKQKEHESDEDTAPSDHEEEEESEYEEEDVQDESDEEVDHKEYKKHETPKHKPPTTSHSHSHSHTTPHSNSRSHTRHVPTLYPTLYPTKELVKHNRKISHTYEYTKPRRHGSYDSSHIVPFSSEKEFVFIR